MLDILIISLFVVWALWSGYRSREKASENLKEYFLAGQTLSGWKSGISMAATQFAADTPLLVMGLIATSGIYANWRLWVYGIAFLMMGFLFARSWRNCGVLTDAELTEARYSGASVSFLRGLKAIYYGTVFNCVVLAMVLVAAVRVAEFFLPWHAWLPEGVFGVFMSISQFFNFSFGQSITGLSPEIFATNVTISVILLVSFTLLYSTTGGLRSVVDTDLMQFAFAMVGTLVFAYFVASEAGGIGQYFEKLRSLYSEAQTHQTLAFAPPPNDLFWPFMVLIGVQWFFQINSDGTGPLAQRMMACRDEKQAKIAAVVFTWSQVFLRSLIWLVIGVGLLILYPYSAEEFTSPGFTALREVTFIRGIQDLLPAGVSGLMLVGLIGALASTVDTHLNWGASYWSNDLYKHILNEKMLKRDVRQKELVWVARLSNLLILIIGLYIMAHLDSIQNAWQISLLFGAGMGPVLVFRWLWEKINIYSEMASMLVSLVLATSFLFIDHGLPEYMQILGVGIGSMIACLAVPFFTPATDADHLAEFYKRVRPLGFWRNSARANGIDENQSVKELQVSLFHLGTAVLSLFLTLVGVGSLIFKLPGESGLMAGLELFCGLSLIPLWYRSL